VFGITQQELVQDAVLISIFLLLAFPVHEFAHAFVAYRLGDGTAKVFGRLTLNPIVHFDPFGGLLLVITALSGSGLLFGWAKPTPVNPSNLRDRRNGEVAVALAGPASNLIMACLGAVVFRVLDTAGVFDPSTIDSVNDPRVLLFNVLTLFVEINIVLAIFNLIPVPPLDGSAILFRLISPMTAWRIRPVLAQYGSIILLGTIFVLFFSPLGNVLGTLINDVTKLLLGL
jgi:Zn-dependent protease